MQKEQRKSAKYIHFTMQTHGFSGNMAEPDKETRKAVTYLREVKHMESISIYGMSMGSVFAVLAARYIQGIDNLILVSHSHVPFEGMRDKKHMSGHSVATWHGRDIPYVSPDFTARKAGKYFYDAESGRKVTGMWIAYRDACQDKERERQAAVRIEERSSDTINSLVGALVDYIFEEEA